jgi:predicted transcriptional regulator
MGKKKSQRDLGRRERQIMDVIYQLEEASVAEVLEQIPDPPSYSSVRTMIRLLEGKGFLRHRRDGNRYLYRPTQSKDTASRSALKHLISTFFSGSAPDAVAAILDDNAKQLSEAELNRLEKLIEEARREEGK